MGAFGDKEGTDRPLILLIENDPGDVFLFRRALSKMCYECDIRVVASAYEAKMFVANQAQFADRRYYRRPRLIVSDFRLQGHTALQFVQWIRTQPDYADIPLVMLSGVISAITPDQFAPFGVTTFIRKTADVESLGSLLRPSLP